MGEEASCCVQLIDKDGMFNKDDLESFVRAVKLTGCGLSYAVVSIMGPQSSGKSTLLNSLFHTHFKEMDAFKGRNQITQGIWISKAVGIDPCTLVMDLEGTDGRERGEDDTVFEKQSALFALAVSDIVLINMWCHDIGRQHAANKPLLKTVFQVMMRLFSPRKTTLLFVIRDMSKTPLEFLEPILREDIQKIWDNVLKPPQHQETPLSEFFNVEVMALSSYEEKEEQFRIQVDLLRQRFFNSISPGGLAGNRREVVPASGFPFSTQQIWERIRENKDLDLPAHKVMVATVRCEAIANEKFVQLTSDGHWHELEKAVRSGPVPGFGKKLSSILKGYISDYELEAAHFDENVRTAKQHQLEFKLLDLVYPSYQAMLEHLHSEALNKFKNELQLAVKNGEAFAAAVCHCTKSSMDEFDLGCADATIQQATWDALEHQSKLRCDIDAYVASVRFARLSEIKTQFENHLNEELGEPVASLLATASADTWPTIRKILICETKSAISEFSFAIAGFEIDEDTVGKMVESLKDYGRHLIYKKAREEASHVLLHMKDRFSTVFSHGVKSMPRVWTGKEDVRALTKDARLVMELMSLVLFGVDASLLQ